jgi:hypothetical protein
MNKLAAWIPKAAEKDETAWYDPITQDHLSFAVRQAYMA